MSNTVSIGVYLRQWRMRRRLSQLDLACNAEISTRHLSFLETGRASPSREMVLRLAEHLDVPLRERNTLLLAAGFAPAFAERPLDDPAMRAVRNGISTMLRAHAPFPALAVDRHWTLIEANEAVASLLDGVAPALLAPPVNVLRLGLHPDGIAPRIINYAEWRAHLLHRLRRQSAESGDAVLLALLQELSNYPAPAGTGAVPAEDAAAGQIAVPLRLRTASGELAFLSTTMVFGAPADITLAEVAIETFLPADEATARALRGTAPS